MKTESPIGLAWQRWQGQRRQAYLNRRLVQAVHKHDEDAVSTWLQSGANANATDKKGDPILLYAAAHCSHWIVRLLLDVGADIHVTTHEGDTVLMKAGHHCHQQEKYDLLLDRGADVHARNRYGQTALMHVDDPNYIVLLLCHDIDMDVRDNTNRTARMLRQDAALEAMGLPHDRDTPGPSHDQIINLLKKNPKRIRSWKFAEAASKGNIEKLRSLLAQGADVNGRDANGVTALCRAISNVQSEAVRFLLEHGANPNAGLMWAIRLFTDLEQPPDYLSMLRLLLEHGADTEATCTIYNHHQVTPLMHAAWSDTMWLPQVLALLLEFGANVHARDSDGNTALIGAAAHKIPVLVAAGADLNAQNKEGNSALMWGAKYAEVDIVHTLLAYGADISLRNQEGKTVLDLAKEARTDSYLQQWKKDLDQRVEAILELLRQVGAQE